MTTGSNNSNAQEAPESTSTGIIVGVLITLLIIILVLIFGLPYLRGRGTGTPPPQSTEPVLEGTLNTTL